MQFYCVFLCVRRNDVFIVAGKCDSSNHFDDENRFGVRNWMYDCDTVNLRRKAEKIKKNDDSNLICGNFTFERSHKIVQRPSSFGNWGKEK